MNIMTRELAAKALDLTHPIGERGPKTFKARQRPPASSPTGRNRRNETMDSMQLYDFWVTVLQYEGTYEQWLTLEVKP